MTDGTVVYTRDSWAAGDAAWFEYHCLESDESADADLWRRSQDVVTVVRHDQTDHDCVADFNASLASRVDDDGAPCLYVVRFADGREAAAFEDELLTDPAGYSRSRPEGGTS